MGYQGNAYRCNMRLSFAIVGFISHQLSPRLLRCFVLGILLEAIAYRAVWLGILVVARTLWPIANSSHPPCLGCDSQTIHQSSNVSLYRVLPIHPMPSSLGLSVWKSTEDPVAIVALARPPLLVGFNINDLSVVAFWPRNMGAPAADQ